MSTSTQKINHELINIQVAIELDKGKKIAEVAEKFGLKISAVKAVARELVTETQQKKTVKSSRFTDPSLHTDRSRRSHLFENVRGGG